MNKKFLLIIAGFSLAVLCVSIVAIRINLSTGKKNSQQVVQTAIQESNILLPSTDFVLGQNFVVGISGTTLDEQTKKFLEQIKPAGVILYSRNYQTRDQLKNLITELQEFAKTTTNHHYFIMIDEEPGGATRLNLFKNVFSEE